MLSVLITYYNERTLLTECLESLAGQMDGIDEVLIYDDASAYPAADYIAHTERVRVIRGQSNIGPSRARNRLLAESRSAYIHFHDSDDLFDPKWAETVALALSKNAVDALFSEVSFFVDDRSLRRESVMGLQSVIDGQDFLSFCILGSLLTPSGTYRKDIVTAIGGYRSDVWQSEDFDFHIRLIASGITYCIVAEPLVLCRSRPDSRSQNRVEVLQDSLKALRGFSVELPDSCRKDIAERAARIGAALYSLGAVSGYREAFRLADECGPPRLGGRHPGFRRLAGVVGLEWAERIAAKYRRLIRPGATA